MDHNYQLLFDAVERNKQLILDAERQIWNNPEPGYREWKTNAYLKEQYEKLGYTLHEAGNIPGFYADIDTGRPGPKVAIFGEMDSLIIPSHPECDKETGAVHSCGHHCQSAALLGVAAAFKEEGVLDGLCGSIRLIAVPAEEAIELEFRCDLIKKGIIKYPSGKQEFIYRGYLDGVDMAFMIHTAGGKKYDFDSNVGCNGCIVKTAVFKGKSSHAGGSPHNGKNALYAATNAMNVANALRETFKDNEHVRFHPIITKGGGAVNAIPDEVRVESYLRGSTMSVMLKENEKINRAFACAAAAMGCNLQINDMHGMAPRTDDENMTLAFKEVACLLTDESRVATGLQFSTGCTDMGDIGCIMPIIHPHVSGAIGESHGSDYYIDDPYKACVMSAKIQVGLAAKLLCNNAAIAKKVLENKKVNYASKEEYLAAIDSITSDFEAVKYNEDGTLSIKYKK